MNRGATIYDLQSHDLQSQELDLTSPIEFTIFGRYAFAQSLSTGRDYLLLATALNSSRSPR